ARAAVAKDRTPGALRRAFIYEVRPSRLAALAPQDEGGKRVSEPTMYPLLCTDVPEVPAQRASNDEGRYHQSRSSIAPATTGAINSTSLILRCAAKSRLEGRTTKQRPNIELHRRVFQNQPPCFG